MKLSELIKQERFSSPAQHTLLNVLVTGNWITGHFTATLAPYAITLAQYNVMRILRGSHPTALTCSDIGHRLLDRTPDVTRLLNRLERAGLIQRARADHDRRIVEVRLVPKGLEVLDQIHPVMEGTLAELAKHLTEADLDQLSTLLDQMREDQQ